MFRQRLGLILLARLDYQPPKRPEEIGRHLHFSPEQFAANLLRLN
jgi:hypothetical protein